MTVPHTPRNYEPLTKRTFHGEQSESPEELEILSLRAQLREVQAENERLKAEHVKRHHELTDAWAEVDALALRLAEEREAARVAGNYLRRTFDQPAKGSK